MTAVLLTAVTVVSAAASCSPNTTAVSAAPAQLLQHLHTAAGRSCLETSTTSINKSYPCLSVADLGFRYEIWLDINIFSQNEDFMFWYFWMFLPSEWLCCWIIWSIPPPSDSTPRLSNYMPAMQVPVTRVWITRLVSPTSRPPYYASDCSQTAIQSNIYLILIALSRLPDNIVMGYNVLKYFRQQQQFNSTEFFKTKQFLEK